MNNRSYYAKHNSACLPDILEGNRASDEAPLIVNCAGNFETAFPFQTDNPQGRDDFYLMYVLRGTLVVRLPMTETTVSAGTLLLFPPHYHYRYTYTAESEPLHYLWTHFSGSHVMHYLTQFRLCPLPLVRSCGILREAIATFESIFDTFVKGSMMRDAALACHLEQLLLTFASDRETERPYQAIRRSLHYIEFHYAEKFSVSELAAMENLSYSRYHDVFVTAMGCSCKRYIIRKRLDHACELLLHTDMNVQQIGAQVGYDDVHFFSKLFKKELKCTPLAYRNRKAMPEKHP